VNSMFNNFHNIYLRFFYASFPNKEIKQNSTNNDWILKGTRTSCKIKRELLLLCRHSEDFRIGTGGELL
jgi:hypothetical protein